MNKCQVYQVHDNNKAPFGDFIISDHDNPWEENRVVKK